ncbi:monocarboxylate transporter 13-like [Ptychodera flava]|uniref:monocarboxylate transporter 13-like n=1 Tax=Ptychodera flava TaxID=63121 RepID=UPI00396A1E95
MTQEQDGDDPPDGGWGWMVVLSSFLAQMLQAGTLLATGVLVSELTEHFDSDVAEVSIIFSVAIGLWCLMGPFSSFLVEKYGTRATVSIGAVLSIFGLLISNFATSVYFLWVSYGILVGSGHGMVSTPTFAVLGTYFKRRLGMANSLSLTGMGAGYIAFSPLNQILLENYGWRGWFILIAAINGNLFVCAALIRPIVKKRSKAIRGSNSNRISAIGSRYCEFVANARVFMFILLAECLSTLTYSTIALLIVPFAIDHGITKLSASLLMTVMGIASIVTRLFCGMVLDLKCLTVFRGFIPTLSMWIIGGSLIAFPYAEDYVIMAILCGTLGVAQGVYYPGMWLVVKSVTGPNYTMAVGLVLFCSGIGNVSGPPFAGVLYDNTHSFKLPFLSIGLAGVLSGLLYLGIVLKVQSRKVLPCRRGHRKIPSESNKIMYDVFESSITTGTPV